MKRLAYVLCGLLAASAAAPALAQSAPTVARIASYEAHATTVGLSVTYRNYSKPAVVAFQLSERSDMGGLKVANESNEPGTGALTTAHAFLKGLHPDRAYWYRMVITTANGQATSEIGTFRTTEDLAVKPTMRLEKFIEYDANRIAVSYIAYAPGVPITFVARWSLRADMHEATVYDNSSYKPAVGAVGYHPMFTLSSVRPGARIYFTATITTQNGSATTAPTTYFVPNK